MLALMLYQNLKKNDSKEQNAYFSILYFSEKSVCVVQVILVWSLMTLEPASYGNVKYPAWGLALGWCMVVFILLWIPGFAIYKLIRTEGSPWQVSVCMCVYVYVCVEKTWLMTVVIHISAFQVIVLPIKRLASLPGHPSRRTLRRRTVLWPENPREQIACRCERYQQLLALRCLWCSDLTQVGLYKTTLDPNIIWIDRHAERQTE